MKVDESTATFSARYGEQVCYFCAQGCLLAFAKEPEKYVGQAGQLLHIKLARGVPGTEPDGPLIRVRGLRKIYQRGKEEVAALRGVDLDIHPGEFVTVMGPSGCGKSTFLHLVGGIDRPSDGQIVVDGQDIGRMGEEQLTRFRREKVGFIFQFYNLLPTLTALENVELPLVALGYPKAGRRKMAQATLELVGLGDRLTHKPNELSGGEQQRVAIARAIVANHRLILADEPTGDLDSAASAAVVGLMRELNEKLGLTFVVVTHDPEVGA
ncbi:MAG TPA: ATP-binding cassette domain-containing protein, partial [Anaerolineae bacterium]|nr:ATP-binding cassette domain-containing protein [Anaerolineae bacterium]